MATGSTSRMLLPEAFTGSNNLESYVTHFELLAELQKWKRTEGDPAREVDDRPHYFAISLQKSAIEFYRTLPQATRENYDECVKAFREHYSKKPVVFRGRLARRVQQPGEKLKEFLGDLKQLALRAYPTETQDIRGLTIVGLTIGGDFQRQDLVNETDVLEERNRLGGTTGRVSSAEPVDKKDTFRGIVEIVSYVEVPNT